MSGVIESCTYPIIHALDEGGRKTVFVPLLGGSRGYAGIDEHDFHALMELGLSPTWSIQVRGTVTAPCAGASGNTVSVARVLLDLGPGESVTYANGNSTDLRRDNLSISYEGNNAVRRDRDFVKHLTRQRGPKIKRAYRIESKEVSEIEWLFYHA